MLQLFADYNVNFTVIGCLWVYLDFFRAKKIS
jgi:hypothetical protein